MNNTIEFLKQRYQTNRYPELLGSRAHSDTFFTTWQEEGLVPAYQGLVSDIEDYSESDIRWQLHLQAIAVLGYSALATTGVPTYVGEVKAIRERGKDLNSIERSALSLYSIALLPLMASWPPDDDPSPDEIVDLVTYQNELEGGLFSESRVVSKEVDRRPMTRHEANEAIKARERDPNSRGWSSIE